MNVRAGNLWSISGPERTREPSELTGVGRGAPRMKWIFCFFPQAVQASRFAHSPCTFCISPPHSPMSVHPWGSHGSCEAKLEWEFGFGSLFGFPRRGCGMKPTPPAAPKTSRSSPRPPRQGCTRSPALLPSKSIFSLGKSPPSNPFPISKVSPSLGGANIYPYLELQPEAWLSAPRLCSSCCF